LRISCISFLTDFPVKLDGSYDLMVLTVWSHRPGCIVASRMTGGRRIGGKLVLAPVHQGGQRSGEHLQGLIYGFFFAEDVGVPSSGYLSLWNPATRRGRRSGHRSHSSYPI
jgi:hypothetical protein